MSRRYWNEGGEKIAKVYEEFGFWEWLEETHGNEPWRVFQTGEAFYKHCFDNRIYAPLNFHKNFSTNMARVAEQTDLIEYIGTIKRSKHYKLSEG